MICEFSAPRAASTLLEEFESVPLVAAWAVIAPLIPAMEVSTLVDEFAIEFELAFIAASAASTLEDELESERLEVCAVVIATFAAYREASVAPEELERVCEEVCAQLMAALSAPSVASVLDDEFDIEFELALIAARAASKLFDDVERYALEVWFVLILVFAVTRAASTLEELLESERDEV